jgi:hypothetical protein
LASKESFGCNEAANITVSMINQAILLKNFKEVFTKSQNEALPGRRQRFEKTVGRLSTYFLVFH